MREVLALWRETGEWWAHESPREVLRYLDDKGGRREVITALDSRGDAQRPEERRILKQRDEKVAWAFGCEREPTIAPSADTPEPYALLHALSGYAFGRSNMLAAELPAFHESRRYQAVLLADPFSLMGAMEFARFAKKAGIKPLIGATFEMAEGGELVLVARTALGYRNLSRLITDCHLGEPRLFPLCTWERLEKHAEDLLCLTGGDSGVVNRLVVKRDYEGARAMLDRLIGLYGREDVFVQIERSYLPWELSANRLLIQLAEDAKVTPVAGGPITHRRPEHFPAQDVLVCVETLCTIDEVVGRKPLRDPSQPQIVHPPRRALNDERYLHTPEELRELFRDRLDLVENTLRVADRCEEDILPGRVSLPKFCDDEPALLRDLTYKGALCLYGDTKKVKGRLEMELQRIIRNEFTAHFLIAWDMCRWSTEQGILLSGRGSVVDSAVAYCLGLSRVDAIEHKLHFDRFLPEDAKKRPDIDIDFEAHRRNDVRNYLADKYGNDHVATVAAVGAYGTRGIVREVGKVMGIPEENLNYLSKRLHGSVSAERLEYELDHRPELRDSSIPRERFHWVFALSQLLMDVPRNARAHSSGVIVSANPIADTVPVMVSGDEGVRIIQWDKRSAKHCFDKFDVLCLRGNDVLSDTQTKIRKQMPEFDVKSSISLDDPEPYRVMRAGQLIGVPQSASPAMRQAHIRIGTKNFNDASIVQAAIRPGVGGAVKLNEFILRHKKLKKFTYNHPLFEKILGTTYGIIVFQEQVDMLLQEFGGYTSDEAEEIREGIYKRRNQEFAQKKHDDVIAKVTGRGFAPEVAEELYQYVAQFQGYGFAQGHAMAFADISIRSVWCQQNYPAEYFAALLNAQPAGYYGPCTIANEARVRGVHVLPPDVNRSDLKFITEDVKAEDDPKIVVPNGGIRVSFEQIGGLNKETRERIVERRLKGEFTSFFDFVARARPDRDELEKLILCGAFDSLADNRRMLLWAIPRAQEYAALMASMEGALPIGIEEPPLPGGVADYNDGERAIYERSILGMDVQRHLMAFERERVKSRGGLTAAEAGSLPNNTVAFAVGNPIRLRFPPTSSGRRVMFFDLEDESGLLNVTCFDDVYQRDGHTVICTPYITVRGVAQHRDGHIAFLAQRIYPYEPTLRTDVVEPVPIVTADYLVG